MEDEQIVALYWARSERAIRESMSKYGAYCQAIAFNILSFRSDAEEAVNDTWLGAWNAMPPAQPAILRTFLGKITRRVSLKRLRDLYREKRGGGQVELALEELDECVSGGSTPEQAVSEKELGEALRRFVDGLPSPDRGCAIFLHCATGATGGCVGLPEQEMRRVLTWLDPELHPYILISGRA